MSTGTFITRPNLRTVLSDASRFPPPCDFMFAPPAVFVPPAPVANRHNSKDAGHQNDEGHLEPWHLVLLLVLLISPCLALHRLSAFVGGWWLLGYAITISLLTYAVYGADKDSAQDKGSDWRAPERLLHGLELAGGWPGAFLAQRRLRHKCSKVSYQITFWLIVSLHIYVATDYLLGWRLVHALGNLLFGAGAKP
jgi:uncharacterized membrane protein YsdA (DUF1294 family)